jgi:hypothetical protein
MSTSFRGPILSILLIAIVAKFTGPARAADIAAAPFRADHRHCYWHARGELIAGVRGATPLTVPFFGSRWYPGPAYYDGPLPRLRCRVGGETVVSVRY